MIDLRNELKQFYQSRQMSSALYRELWALAQVVFYGKGLRNPDVCEELFSSFLEKRFLKFSPVFYLQLDVYNPQQVRGYLSRALKLTVMDYFRGQSFFKEDSAKSLVQEQSDFAVTEKPSVEFYVESVSSLDQANDMSGDAWELHLPEILKNEYRLMAQVVYKEIWKQLKPEQREVFCLLYSAGKTIQEISDLKKMALGTVQNYKQRIGEIAYREAEVREIAEMAYQQISLTCCESVSIC